jgi:hypothetical protein
LALNDGRLTFGDGHRMRLDMEPFPANVNVIDFEGKKILVRASQADSTRGKDVVVSDELRPGMMKP